MRSSRAAGRCMLATLLAMALSIAFTATASLTQPADSTVWVFTADRLPPLQNLSEADRLFVLDAAENVLGRLSFPNPGNDVQARVRAMALIQSPTGQMAIERMRDSGEATVVAWQHGIAQLPAVLIDQQFVVYGVYDVALAMQQIARYRDAR